MEHDPSDTGTSVGRALRRLLRERAARRPGGHALNGGPGLVRVAVELDAGSGEQGDRAVGRALVEAIDRALDDEVRRAVAYRPGAVYCHRCRDASCEHATPPDARHVFVGYAASGRPRWVELGQACLELRHPRVDALYDDPPALVAIVQSGAALHAALAPAIDDEISRVEGQVIAGYYAVAASAEEGRGVLALSLQVVSSRTRAGGVRFGLNLVGVSPSGGPLESLWDRQHELPWRRAVRWAQSAVASLPARRGTAERPVERIEGILLGVARRLERERRARHRRTRHAESRHTSGGRPTRKAVDDARAADDPAIYLDARSDTLVVLGERGRTHFFSRDGQLVSSVRYSREAIARKVRLELWRPAPAADAAALRARLR